MPRKKTQNKLDTTQSLEKYNTTLPNNLDSLNTNINLHNDDNINTIIKKDMIIMRKKRC